MSTVANHLLSVSIWRGEPDLGPLEPTYRQFSLPADINQIIRIGWLLIAAIVVYAVIDYFSGVPAAYLTAPAVIRVVMIAFSLGAIFVLRRTTNYAVADGLVLVWSILVVSFSLYVHFIYVDSMPQNVLGDLVLIIGFYAIFPNRLPFRILPALLLSVGDLLLVRLAALPLNDNDYLTVTATMLIGNLCGYVISVHLYTYRRQQFLAERENERLATLDSLTQVLNRRRFMELAEGEFQRFRRYPHPFSLLLLDLDHFKQINDTHGHAAGDAVLKAVAAEVAALIRQSDHLGRLGGEEFAILLPETPAAEALQLAERIRERCAQVRIPSSTSGAALIQVTASIGVTEGQAADTSPEDTLRRADQALYYVKAHGRNGAHLSNG